MARQACEACGRAFEPKRTTQRFCCATCRQRGHRGAVVTDLSEVRGDLTLVEATKVALVEAGRERTPAGVRALLLAADLDRGGDTGSARASLSKAHGEALDAALKGAPTKADAVDDLKAQRAKRLAGG